jgi:UDP-N-acetyl-2-amino-2-deoxyglucuronate dehydrogenase
MPEQLGIGMIGCGEIAVQTAKGVAGAAHARHVMVMDVDERVARDLGGAYGVPSTTSVEALLANPDVDAVYIAVPHYLHAPIGLQALRAGKHVLLEKPIATTLRDADALIAGAKEAGRTLSIAFTAQVDRAMQAARRLIADGAIGKVIGTRIVYRSQKPESYWHGGYSGRIQTDWRIAKAKAGGGILIMNAVHDLNTLRFVTGLEVRRVYAEYDTFTTPVEVEDFIAVTWRPGRPCRAATPSKRRTASTASAASSSSAGSRRSTCRRRRRGWRRGSGSRCPSPRAALRATASPSSRGSPRPCWLAGSRR